MGDEAVIRYGKRPAGDGLEFVGAPKRLLFKQYTEQFKDASNVTKKPHHKLQPEPSKLAESDYRSEHDNLWPTANYSRTTHSASPRPHANAQADNANEMALAEPVAAELDTMILDEDEDIPKSAMQYPSKELNTQHKKHKLKSAITIFFALLCVAVIAVSLLYMYKNKSLIPDGIRKTADFSLYVPVNNEIFTADPTSVQKGDNESVVYNLNHKVSGERYIVSQQKSPDLVKDDGQFMLFLAQIDKFASFDSVLGKTYLTKPADTGDDVTLVIKTDSTLIFIRGPGTTPDESWVQLLSVLKILK